MPGFARSALGLAVAGALAFAVATDSSARGSCTRLVRPVAVSLPAPIVVTTDCGRYRFGRSGRVSFRRGSALPVPAGADYFMDLTWYRFDRGHLVIGHRKRTLWRSSRRFDTASHDLGIVASSRAAVAYSVFRGRRQSLFIARLGEAERKVGVGEVALGFVGPRALVAERAGTLVLRRGRDWRPQRVADHAGNVVFDHAEHALYFVAHGWLERFDGGRVRRLARLAALGVGRRPQIEPLGKLVGLHSGRRLVVLHDDGSAFASTALPRPRARVDTVSSALAADAQGTAVAFTVSSGNSGYASRGSELVYLLRPGSTAARAVFRERLTFAVCERAASLAWRGPWLLYSSTEERVAVIDTRQPSRSIDLSRKVARLPGMGGDNGRFDAAWG